MNKLNFLKIYLRNRKHLTTLMLLECMVAKSKVDLDYAADFQGWLDGETSTIRLRELTAGVGLGYWVDNDTLTVWLKAQDMPAARRKLAEHFWSNMECHNVINPLDSGSLAWRYRLD